MGFVFTKEWDTAVEKQVRDFSETLSEKTGGGLRPCKRASWGMAA